jgi:sarcosine oxidase
MARSVGVVGAGIVGLATAFALSDRGANVTLYERGLPGNAQSGGATRIFRHGHRDPRLVSWAVRSRRQWTSWQQRSGAELVSPDGVIGIGPSAADRFPLLRDTEGVEVRKLGDDELADELPLLAPQTAGPVVFDMLGGAIRTRTATESLVASLHVAIVSDEVYAVHTTARGNAEIRAGGMVSTHDAVVVCAGAGTAGLARGVGLELPVRREAALRLTFAVRGTPPSRLACLQDSSGVFGEASAYGSPLPGNLRYAVGLGETVEPLSGSEAVDPASFVAVCERTRAYVRRALPGLAPDPIGHRHCWITRLPWDDDAFAAWEADRVLFFAGHNLYKHAPAIGLALSDWAIEGRLDPDLHPEARLGDPEYARADDLHRTAG